MEERTVIISSRELVDHAVLVRKRNELSFKKDLLLRTGAKPEDMHVKVLEGELAQVEGKLAPILEKLAVADLLTIVPSRKEIEEYTLKINQYSRGEIDVAVKGKSGEVYELMKKRAVLVKSNFEKKDDIARAVVLVNSFPRKEAEAVQLLIEDGQGADVDVSFLPKEKQQELVDLAARLGRQCCVFAGSFSTDKKKADAAELKAPDEVLRMLPGGKRVWVGAGKLQEFDANEKAIAELLAKIQAKNAEKQARSLTEEESAYFDKIQEDYLSALAKRNGIAKGMELSESVKVYKKESWKKLEEHY